LNLNKCFINLSYETQTDFIGFSIGKYQSKTDYVKIIFEGIEIMGVQAIAIDAPVLFIPIKKILER